MGPGAAGGFGLYQERSVLSGGRPGGGGFPPGFQLGRAPLVLSPRRARLCLLAPLYGCSVGPVPDLSGERFALAVLGLPAKALVGACALGRSLLTLSASSLAKKNPA